MQSINYQRLKNKRFYIKVIFIQEVIVRNMGRKNVGSILLMLNQLIQNNEGTQKDDAWLIQVEVKETFKHIGNKLYQGNQKQYLPFIRSCKDYLIDQNSENLDAVFAHLGVHSPEEREQFIQNFLKRHKGSV